MRRAAPQASVRPLWPGSFILPIPGLDGGHVLFLLYEMITRRKPSENFLIKAEYVGITVLVLLMVVANLNDILRWIGVL